MNRSRMLFVSAVALALSVFITFAVYRLLRQRLSKPDEYVQVVVAAEKLPLGSRITAAEVRTMSWPKSAWLEGSFTNPNEIEGRGVITAIYPNEPILEAKLAPKEAGAGLTTVIPEGMRAVSVKVNDKIADVGERHDREHRLSGRAGQILDLLRQGLSDKEIAAQLGLSRHTVNEYTKTMYARFGVHSRSSLIAQLFGARETPADE